MSQLPILWLGAMDRVSTLQPLLGERASSVMVADFPGPCDDDLALNWLAIVDGDQRADAATFASRWRKAQSTRRPLLWIAGDLDGRAFGWQNGADACLSPPFGAGELAAQVQALWVQFEERERLGFWANEASRLNRTLTAMYAQLELDTQLAGIIQNDFGGEMPTQAGRIRWSVCRRSALETGGDFFAARILHRHNAALMLGDVMGHSLGASLLVTRIQQLFAKMENLSPEAMLSQINRELLRLAAPEPPLVRATAALIDCETGVVCYSTAGHTAPLLLAHNKKPQFRPSPGPMLGLGECAFSLQKLRLNPSDRLLLFTDGLLDGSDAQEPDFTNAAVESQALPLAAHVEKIAQRQSQMTTEKSDFTLVGIEMA